MKDIVSTLTARFREEHRNARRYVAMLLVLALVTTLFVNWQLHSDGIAATAQYQCGEVEHQHTADCYEKVVICGYTEGEVEDWNATMPDDDMLIDEGFGIDMEEDDSGIATYSEEPEYIFVPHEHTDDCYQEVQTLTCYEQEHVHTDDCFDPEDGSLICDEFEHTHDDSCYTTEYELVCGLEEGELVEELNPDYNPIALFEEPIAAKPVVIAAVTEPPVHYHTEDCYEEVLICPLEEHHHTVNCLSDPQADVEDEEEWLAKTNTTLTGLWTDDLLTVAQSQLGYEQSEKNFQLDTDDGETVRHYTRYGQWYGNPYGEWDVMFLSYCLNYAGVPQSIVPQRAGVLALRSDLRGSEWFKDAADARIVPGDVVIYQTTTTETVAVDSEQPAIEDDSADADIALLSLEPAAAEPQTEERTVTSDTVGIVSAVDENGDLTVISGNVDGKVAEVSVRLSDVENVIDLAAAYEAQGEDESGQTAADADTSDGFYARVTWIGEAVADAAMPATLQAGDLQLTEVANITDVIFRKLVGKDYVVIENGEEVTDGQQLQILVKYGLLAGKVSKANPTVCYQLPKGIKLTEAVTDKPILNTAGEKKGTYSISEDGEVRLTFTDETILAGANFDGEFQFDLTVDYASADNNEIRFTDGCAVTITVPKELTVDKGFVDKGWMDDKGNIYYNWYVDAISTKGTGTDTVTIWDDLSNRNAAVLATYVEDTVKVVKVLADGTQEEQTLTEDNYKLDNNSIPRTIKVKDLPALKAGEKYRLLYTAKITPDQFDGQQSGARMFYNTGYAEAGSISAKKDQQISFGVQRLQKSVKEDLANGCLNWTIILSAPRDLNGGFLCGYTVKDLIDTTLAQTVDVPGDTKVTVKGKRKTDDGKDEVKTLADDLTIDKLKKDGYTIPDGYDYHTYTFTFSTPLPKDQGTVTVQNTATAEKGGYTYTASAEKTFTSGEWTDISKKYVRTEDDVAYWDISAANSAGETEFTLADTLSNAVDKTTGQEYADTHYAIARELKEAIEKNLQLTLRSGTKQTYAQAQSGIEIHYYKNADYTGEVYVGGTEHVRSFTITVKNSTDPVRSISLTDVPTHEARGQTPSGDTWEFRNTASILQNGETKGSSTDKDTYECYRKFEKSVSTDGSKNFQTGSVNLEWEDVKSNKLYYQLRLVTAADETNDIVITDTLPTNLTYKSAECTIDGNKISQSKWEVDASSQAGKLIFTIPKSSYNPDGQSHQILIEYRLEGVLDDPRWNDLTKNELEYTNEAEWGTERSSTTTTVTRTVEEIQKSGEPVENSNRVRYKVYVNPQKKTLANGAGSKIELDDVLSVTSGESAVHDLASVKLYYYDPSETDADYSQEVPVDFYEKDLYYNADGKTTTLKMQIPDAQAFVLVYECIFNTGTSAAPKLENTVTLAGKKYESNNTEVKHESSSATIRMGQLTLNKTDSASGELLKGATFKVEYYDQTDSAWKTWDTRQVDGNGQLSLSITENVNDTLRPDTLYKITEEEAPEYYIKDTTERFFIFQKIDSSSLQPEEKAAAWLAATGVDAEGTLTAEKNTLTINDVQFGRADNETVVSVPNRYSRLTVKKYWLDQDTQREIDPEDIPVEFIEVKLYRYTTDPNDLEEVEGQTRKLNADNKWSYTWSGDEQIPATDGDGNEYHYVVKEETDGSWRLETDGNGVQTGYIILKNIVYSNYFELPSTGGMGTAPFAAVGGAVMAGAVLLLTARKKRKEEEGE